MGKYSQMTELFAKILSLKNNDVYDINTAHADTNYYYYLQVNELASLVLL